MSKKLSNPSTQAPTAPLAPVSPAAGTAASAASITSAGTGGGIAPKASTGLNQTGNFNLSTTYASGAPRTVTALTPEQIASYGVANGRGYGDNNQNVQIVGDGSVTPEWQAARDAKRATNLAESNAITDPGAIRLARMYSETSGMSDGDALAWFNSPARAELDAAEQKRFAESEAGKAFGYGGPPVADQPRPMDGSRIRANRPGRGSAAGGGAQPGAGGGAGGTGTGGAPGTGGTTGPGGGGTPSTGGIGPTAFNAESVVDQFGKIISSDSNFMARARQDGLNAANSRGLLNSSIAVGAAEAEANKAALPLAQQEAQTAAARNEAQRQRDAQMAMLEKQIASAEGQQKLDLQAQLDRLREQGKITGGLQDKESLAQLERLKLSLSNSDSQQAKAIAAQMEQLKTQIEAATGQQKAELEAQLERLKISGQQELDRLTKAATLDQDRVKLQGSIEAALSAQGAQQQAVLTTLQGDINKALQFQSDGATMERLKASFAQDVSMQQQQHGNTLAQIAATGDQNFRQLLQQQQGSLQELSMQIAAGDRARIAELSVSIFAQESAMRQALLSNPQMPASERAAYERAISSLGEPVRAYLNGLYAPPGSTPATGGGIAPTAGTTPAPAVGGIAPSAQPPNVAGLAPINGQYYYNNGQFFDLNGAQLSASQVQKMNGLI